MRRTSILAAALSGFLLAVASGLAFAHAAHDTVKTARVAQFGSLVVAANGRTVYELAPETAHHLLCTSSACLQAWPPVTVRSAKTKLHKPHGIKGRLGRIHRRGFFQVTLGGRPLYYFAGDGGPGQAHGDKIPTFGGTWHVVKAKSAGSGTGTGTTTSTTTPSTTTTTPYGY